MGTTTLEMTEGTPLPYIKTFTHPQYLLLPKVIYMSEGRIVESGPFQRLMAEGGQFATMMKEVQVDEEEKALEVSASVVPAVGTVGTAPEAIIGMDGTRTTVKLITDEASSKVGGKGGQLGS